MQPFRSSFSARMVTAGATLALVGGGLVPLLRLPAIWVTPVLLATIVCGIIGLLAGVERHFGPALVLAIVAPLGLWLYACALFVVVERLPDTGWFLIGLGVVPLGLFVGSFGGENKQVISAVGAPSFQPK